ncbi:ABC transporter ATP-binding protein [Roseibium algae]|uniref:ABC transporter ATP-binding protein n=1 Tax=Roseibium algae TaxID=3123038 RepID=A0ABU8TG54_9HYPH
MTSPILSIRDLETHFFTRGGVVKAVNKVSLDINEGKILGLVGESGSGKSITGFSIMQLIDEPGRIVGGSIKLKGEELVSLSERQMRDVRGKRISMIFQDPMMTLNPVLKIGAQMTEAITAHEKVSKRDAWQRARDGLAEVGIPSPEERLEAYPHQLSGGMRQRVAIAIAFLNRPEFIIADEPTTALDVTIQGQILAQAQKLCSQYKTAMIWITHDLSVVSGLADEIAVMYAGRIVEQGPSALVLNQPRHPYTAGLIKSVPGKHMVGHRLYQIPGMTPSLLTLGDECAFQARCPHKKDQCKTGPAMTEDGARLYRCHNPITGLNISEELGA